MEITPELLIGEWDIIKFAYTKNGVKFLNETFIPDTEKDGIITISNESEKWGFDEKLFGPFCYGIGCFFYSMYGHLMSLSEYYPLNTGYLYIPFTDIHHALHNAQSCAIMSDELWIYFTGLEEKNVLILKKIKQ